jgi:hypothetical protein
MIKAAELQGVLGRNYSRLSLNPRYSFDLAVHEARLAQDYAIGLIRGGLLLGGTVQGKARAAAKRAGGRGQGLAQWNAALVALSTADTRTGGHNSACKVGYWHSSGLPY